MQHGAAYTEPQNYPVEAAGDIEAMTGEAHESRATAEHEIARSAFDMVENQVTSLEGKARTYLTINSLLVGSGVLSIARLDLGDALCGTRSAIATVGALLFLSVTSAVWQLLRVLSIRSFEGPPDPRSTSAEYQNHDAATLDRALTAYFTSAFETNARLARSMASSLKLASFLTKCAFVVFAGGMLLVLATNLFPEFFS